MTPTRWSSPERIPVGTQLALSHDVRPGDLARACFPTECSHTLEPYKVAVLDDPPSYDDVHRRWSWTMPGYAFALMTDELVLVVSISVVQVYPLAPLEGPWDIKVAYVRSLKPGGDRNGWCDALALETPLR